MTAPPDGTLTSSPETGVAPASGGGRRWQPWALAAICVAAGLLYVWAIGSGSIGNDFYSAAVKSMTDSFTNFLFGSFDPYGVVTVDKPPMGLWPQVLSVEVFGFHGWSLLLPQAIEGVAAVFLLHRTVRRWAGENVALLAALLLTLTPITVAINRDNNPDTLLVLLLIASAYAFTRSIQAELSAGRTKWILLCAFFVGCGFVTKMMQAWIIVPGLALAFLVGVDGPVKRRILDLLTAGGVLIVSSFWWTALHDLWPGSKPYMGGSTDGTAWQLIFGYNGFGRIFGEGGGAGGGGGGFPGGGELPPGVQIPGGGRGGTNVLFGGDTGITRMFGASAGGQISWLLPLCLLVLVVVSVAGALRLKAKLPGDRAQRAGWVLWGSWLLVTGLVFSYAQGIWHPYYTTMLAPAVAAIGAAGLARLWRLYRGAGEFAWALLPLAIVLTAVWAFVLTSRDTSWNGGTRWFVLGTGAVAAFGLVAGRLSEHKRTTIARPALVLGLVSMLLTPTVWSTATALEHSGNATIPVAGPSDTGGFGGFGGGPGGARGGAPGGALPAGGLPGGAPPAGAAGRGGGFGGQGGTELSTANKKILDYAVKNSGGAQIKLAVEGGANAASTFILGSDEVVIGMGGFMGSDDAPTVSQLQQWVDAGTLKFVLGDAPTTGSTAGGGFGARGGGVEQDRTTWVQQHCQVVNPSAYGGAPASATQQTGGFGRGQSQTLYTCK